MNYTKDTAVQRPAQNLSPADICESYDDAAANPGSSHTATIIVQYHGEMNIIQLPMSVLIAKSKFFVLKKWVLRQPLRSGDAEGQRSRRIRSPRIVACKRCQDPERRARMGSPICRIPAMAA
jgi:hypothetical protein